MSLFSAFTFPFRFLKKEVLVGVMALVLVVVVISGLTGWVTGWLFALLLGAVAGVIAGRSTSAVFHGFAVRGQGNPIQPLATGLIAVVVAFWLMPEGWIPSRLGFAAMIVTFMWSAGISRFLWSLRS